MGPAKRTSRAIRLRAAVACTDLWRPACLLTFSTLKAGFCRQTETRRDGARSPALVAGGRLERGVLGRASTKATRQFCQRSPGVVGLSLRACCCLSQADGLEQGFWHGFACFSPGVVHGSVHPSVFLHGFAYPESRNPKLVRAGSSWVG